MPWQSVGIKPISEPLRPQILAYEQLWLRVFRLNRGHDAMALSGRKLVHEAKIMKKYGLCAAKQWDMNSRFVLTLS